MTISPTTFFLFPTRYFTVFAEKNSDLSDHSPATLKSFICYCFGSVTNFFSKAESKLVGKNKEIESIIIQWPQES